MWAENRPKAFSYSGLKAMGSLLRQVCRLLGEQARPLLWPQGPLALAVGIGTATLAVNGGVKTDHVAAQNQANVGAPRAMARALV
ncbi:hypothetical protein NHU_04527 (plasmid) [Rhodovulum sulfidophilum]|uniref:Uncharacterized protein n=1 Tax=Rhodovulum sulfidophilum TaxID=35806 RepID=A0A0D6B9Z0_RHOSU|nr:hypothetical protein NHU_04527 [Rhodovulum sulfidophilum]